MEWLTMGGLCVAGGVVNGLLGWFKSKEPWDTRKFIATALTALISGVIFATAYSYAAAISPLDMGAAFLAGAGIDGARKDIVHTIQK